MPRYFECLHCGVITEVAATPPKCRNCGHGTGVLHTRDPRIRKSRPEGSGNKSGQADPKKPDDPSANRTAEEVL